MLQLNPHDDSHCQGIAFAITDENALARAVALVLVQEYALAKRILLRTASAPEGDALTFAAAEINDIIARRLRPPVVYHRDGFLFQLIMWLAAPLNTLQHSSKTAQQFS